MWAEYLVHTYCDCCRLRQEKVDKEVRKMADQKYRVSRNSKETVEEPRKCQNKTKRAPGNSAKDNQR